MLGGTALGRLAVGQESDSTTTIALAAAQGSFTLAGEAAIFQMQ